MESNNNNNNNMATTNPYPFDLSGGLPDQPAFLSQINQGNYPGPQTSSTANTAGGMVGGGLAGGVIGAAEGAGLGLLYHLLAKHVNSKYLYKRKLTSDLLRGSLSGLGAGGAIGAIAGYNATR